MEKCRGDLYMLLPFREHLDFGPTPYDQLQAREGIPIVRGHVVSDVMELELGRWERMGAAGCYLNLANQQQTDGYVCEIPAGSQTLPQRHLFEEIIYIAKGRGRHLGMARGNLEGHFRMGTRCGLCHSIELLLPALQRLQGRTGPFVRRNHLPAHDQYFS